MVAILKIPPFHLFIQMEITMEKYLRQQELFLLNQKNSWKQQCKMGTSLFFNMGFFVPAMPVASY